MTKEIHIVSFDVPYPADYGGVIDVYKRLLWFNQNGYKVHLHCFEYGRGRPAELNIFESVNYYPRKKSFWDVLSLTPFIVKSRINKNLSKTLLKTKGIVLLEGLHSAHYCTLAPGRFWVRTHNVEHHYYRELSRSAPLPKRLFLFLESLKLKRYESTLKKAKGLLTLSSADQTHFSKINSNSHLVYPIIQIKEVEGKSEAFVLIQGNFSVEENHIAALWLINNVLPSCKEIEFIFAGKSPKPQLIEAAKSVGARLWANPTEKEMDLLNRKSRVHVIYSTQATGLKLKVLNALNSNGHLISNDKSISGTPLHPYTSISNTPEEYIEQINEKIQAPPSADELQMRKKYLETTFGGEQLTQILNRL